jgi:hypothetical protein
MKKSILLLTLLSIAVTSVTKLQAQTVSACLHDDAGFTFNFPSLTVTGASYSGKGTADVLAGYNWKVKIKGTSLKNTTITVTNPKADACTGPYVDYFVYDGNATAGLYYATQFLYSGGGTWTSYCSGAAYNTGSWNAWDCAHATPVAKRSGPSPVMSGGSNLIKVSTDAISGSASVAYTVQKSGTVNITVYNSMQQPVKVLVNDFKNAGNYSAVWDTRTANINSGIYRVVAVIDGNTTSTTVQVVQ